MNIGDLHGGGVVVWVDETGNNGIIAATEDLPIQYKWSNNSFPETYANGSVIGSGLNNTERIVNYQGVDTYAAKQCADLSVNGFNDWYLPSKDELMTFIGRDDIGLVPYFLYWSSTDAGSGNAFAAMKGNLAPYATNRANFGQIRPVRTFGSIPYTPTLTTPNKPSAYIYPGTRLVYGVYGGYEYKMDSGDWIYYNGSTNFNSLDLAGVKLLSLRVAAVEGISNASDIQVLNFETVAPYVVADDNTNTIIGMAEGLEYNLDNAGYVLYSSAVFNSLDLSGNHTLLVRRAATETLPVSEVVVLTLTGSETPDPGNEARRITQSSSISMLWSILEASPLKSEITGHIYKLEKPLDSEKEDIVINSLPMANGEVNRSILNANIYVKDKKVGSKGKASLMPDTERLEALENIVWTEFSEEIYPEGYDGNFQLLSVTTIRDEENRTNESAGFHYLNCRFEFNGVNE